MRRFLPYNRKNVERARDLRANMTPAEQKLWFEYLRGLEVRVLRQRPIRGFIVDFYCASRKLVIEVDGAQHFTPEGKIQDSERTTILEAHGLTVVRFSNHEILKNFPAVCQALQKLLLPTNPNPEPNPHTPNPS